MYKLVNSGQMAEDFSSIVFVDQKEVVVRYPVSKTTNYYGDEVFGIGAQENMDAIYTEVPKNNDFWNQFGLVRGKDAIIYVLPAQELYKNDQIVANDKTYRVGLVTDRRRGDQYYYRVAPLFFISGDIPTADATTFTMVLA